MIGLSLSFCVRDILDGIVDISEVEKIITGTCAYNSERWGMLIEAYTKTYWRDYDRIEVLKVITALTDKIEQPRIDNMPYPMIYNGHWVMSEDDIIWSEHR